jgi:hypothetical protein
MDVANCGGGRAGAVGNGGEVLDKGVAWMGRRQMVREVGVED